MINIKRLKVEITSNANAKDVYGFDFTFNNGLNIIAGQNSKGKTTINSCIYYGLGMEELLGQHNEKALDKALKDNFVIEKEGEKPVTFKVLTSKVLIEVENERNEIATILRYIKTDTAEIRSNMAKIYNSNINNIHKHEYSIYYITGRGNTDNPNGFYTWLSGFANIETPTVSNTSRKDNYSPLYLQLIFSTLLIEQTKGWSDFFATMPNFGVPKPKQKCVEFLLELNELKLATKRDILNKNRAELGDKWSSAVRFIKTIEKQHNCSVKDYPAHLTAEQGVLDNIKVMFKVAENESIYLDEKLSALKTDLQNMEMEPISKVGNNREKVLIDYQKAKHEYNELQNHIYEFDNKFQLEILKLSDILKQQKNIDKEIKDHLALQRVFSEKIINKHGGNYCPICSQSVSDDLISSRGIEIPRLGLEENIAFLKGQKDLIDASVISLQKIIDEKRLLSSYYSKQLRDRELMIKSLSRDLIADDRILSESEIMAKLQIENDISIFEKITEQINTLKDEFKELIIKFCNNSIALDSLKNSENEDEQYISTFEKTYLKLLADFGYESNETWKISINTREPFKYFPVYRESKDSIPQSIRINSSASDFVRNIWAYSIALLKVGKNHPGLLVFDEPGQHRTNMKSLKALFQTCSLEQAKQIIIFTSVEKEINETEKIEIAELTKSLDVKSYNLVELSTIHKVIQKLK